MELEDSWRMKKIKMLGAPNVSTINMDSPYTAQSRTDPNCVVGVYETNGEKIRLGQYDKELDKIINLNFEK
jgi:hypothetical protein